MCIHICIYTVITVWLRESLKAHGYYDAYIYKYWTVGRLDGWTVGRLDGWTVGRLDGL